MAGIFFRPLRLVTTDADTVLIGQEAIEYQQKLDAEQRERAGQQAVPANGGCYAVGLAALNP